MRRIVKAVLLLVVIGLVVLAVAAYIGVGYAYEPGTENVISRTRANPEAYDLWGEGFSEAGAQRLFSTSAGKARLSPRNGAVHVGESLLRLGRDSFYKETFGNEVFLSDVVGVLNGPLRVSNVTAAILALKGGGTTNLRVPVPETVTIGGRRFTKGGYFDTGLDVPKGALLPLGMKMVVSGWRIRAGITCALCHATVEPKSFKVIEGAPNQDLNAGLMIALGTNSAAYFMHTDVVPMRDAPGREDRFVTLANGQRERLPDAMALEAEVDKALLMWPRGNFDSLTDLKADPTQNPISFTWQNYPYGWSGNFMAGPFHGLSSQNNNVHALNSDSTLLADASPTMFDMDKELYLGVLLQNAATKRYRYNPGSGWKPSAFLASLRRKTQTGINSVVLPPTYPKGTIISPDGTLTSSPDHLFWEQNNAMAAWQNTLEPPTVPLAVDAQTRAAGRAVFDRAGCSGCHAGPFLSNHQVVAAATVGTNPTRAGALTKTELNFAPAVLYSFDTPVPLPAHPDTLAVPTSGLDPRQVDLAWAHHGSPGGYKVPSLVGLFWSAPYLHDGGVAVGPDVTTQLGIPGTVQQNVLPDASNSLRALVDRDLRARVVRANQSSSELRRMNVEGSGHSFWVDRAAGFSDEEQRALVQFLLSYVPGDSEQPAPVR